MTTGSAKQRIKVFLAPRLGGNELSDDDDIFDLGYVNSLFAVQLLRFVEREFSLTLDSEDLEFGNFRTVGDMVRLVESKKSLAR
jgi:acyl carrier protein